MTDRMRLSADNLIALFGFTIMSAIAVCFAFTPKLVEPLHILGHVGVAEATLGNEYTKRTSNVTIAYNVTYTFVVDGKSYSGASALGEQPRPVMPVQYVTDDPGRNGMELTANAWFDLVIFAVPATVLGICSLVLFLHFKRKTG